MPTSTCWWVGSIDPGTAWGRRSRAWIGRISTFSAISMTLHWRCRRTMRPGCSHRPTASPACPWPETRRWRSWKSSTRTASSRSGWIAAWTTCPRPTLRNCKSRWNDWLVARYTNDAAMLAAWNIVDVPFGANLVANGDFGNGLTGWNPEQHDTARASFARTFEFTDGAPSARIIVTNPGSASWHIQFNYPGLQSLPTANPTPCRFRRKPAPRRISRPRSCRRTRIGRRRVLPWTTGSPPTGSGSRNTFQANMTDRNVRMNFGGMGLKLANLLGGRCPASTRRANRERCRTALPWARAPCRTCCFPALAIAARSRRARIGCASCATSNTVTTTPWSPTCVPTAPTPASSLAPSWRTAPPRCRAGLT